jgi:hypothetical protein
MKKLIILVGFFLGSSQLVARTREPKDPVTSPVQACSSDKTFVCEIKPNADNSYTERVCHCEPKATGPKRKKNKNKSK